MVNNPLERMEINKSKFTKVELEVYDVITNNIQEILRGSLTDFANLHHVSQSSITRFCKKLGYMGFNDFRLDLYHYEKQALISDAESGETIFQQYARLIQKMETVIDATQIQALAKELAQANQIVITGANKSSLPAKMLQLNLMRLSRLSTYVLNDELGECKHFLKKGDFLIIFSASARSKELIQEISSLGTAKIVLITMSDKTPSKNKVDYFIWLPSSKNQNYPSYLDNSIIFSVFADYLSSCVARFM